MQEAVVLPLDRAALLDDHTNKGGVKPPSLINSLLVWPVINFLFDVLHATSPVINKT